MDLNQRCQLLLVLKLDKKSQRGGPKNILTETEKYPKGGPKRYI